MRFVSSAATRKVNAARSASTRAVLIGLPASSAIVRAKSSFAASIPSAMRAEHLGALPRRQLARDLERAHGAGDRGLDLGRARRGGSTATSASS